MKGVHRNTKHNNNTPSTTTPPKPTNSLKALKSPPDIIKRIFDCVLLLRMAPVERVAWWDVKGSMVIAGSYGEAIKMMADSNFLGSLVK
jgi:dynein heavy chain